MLGVNRLGTESAFDVLKSKTTRSSRRQIIHLEIGQPDFQTPIHICEAAFRAMKDGYTGYGPAAGLLELREVIAEHVSTTRGIDISMKSWSPWSQTDYLFTLLALVDEGDEVIYPDPGFPIYESVINFVGAKEFPYLYEKTLVFAFILTIWLISERTRLLIHSLKIQRVDFGRR